MKVRRAEGGATLCNLDSPLQTSKKGFTAIIKANNIIVWTGVLDCPLQMSKKDLTAIIKANNIIVGVDGLAAARSVRVLIAARGLSFIPLTLLRYLGDPL